MEPKLVERILNPWVLLTLNVLLIVASQVTGILFYETGIIHIVAVVFVVLGLWRVFVHYNVYDQFLKPLIHTSFLALILFAAAHVVEGLNLTVWHLRQDAVIANVINMIAISMLLPTLGAERFLRRVRKGKGSQLGTVLLAVGIAAFSALFVYISVNDHMISMRFDTWVPYAYLTVISGIAVFALRRLWSIRSHVSIMVPFINWLAAAFVMVYAVTLAYIFYHPIEEGGVAKVHISYLIHYLFYAAVSLLFLAFARLATLRGMYADIEESST